MTLPYIEKHGGEDLNRCTELILSGVPDVDVDTYMRALAERTRHIREWMVFMERYALVVGPVSTEPPFEVGFDVTDAETTARLLRGQRLLVAVNLLGSPPWPCRAGSPTACRSACRSSLPATAKISASTPPR